MANLLEDIQCAGFDTRPPMLDRTDFASWQQRIRLYCRGPERPRVYFDLSPEDKERVDRIEVRGTMPEVQVQLVMGELRTEWKDNAIDEDMDEQPVQDLALNVDNVFQADDSDAFDFDVNEAPTAQTMFMEIYHP
ncbi:hypothetical protein Tco_0673117 [Tanacetum coccineum]